MAQVDLEQVAGEGNVWVLLLVQGIVAAVIGGLLLAAPKTALTLFALILGIYWIITGFLSILMIAGDRTMWGWKLFIGVLGILAGFVAVTSPLWASAAVLLVMMIFLGVGAIIQGGAEIFRAFKGGGWGQGLIGALNLFIGVLIVVNLGAAVLVAPFVYGIIMLGFGLAAIIMAFRVRKSGGPAKVAATA